ncbi:MAG TPA: PHP-associated domain-containing protein [Thermoanaerobaculia bacterium]|nr:PHP-associated domain-containing protein [Thermoanaerobaculia bacterium]
MVSKRAEEPERPGWFSDSRFKKADLHCHSVYSTFKYFRIANTRDSYNRPEDVYRLAKQRGMDFVTLTDHDSIDGCLYLLNKFPDLDDFFMSEEVETWFPDTRQRIHINVFAIDERQHAEIQKRRENIYDLHAYIREENILASANHMFQNYRMRNSPRQYFDEMLRMFDSFEVKNGAMASQHNRLVEDLMAVVREKRGDVSLVAGSDAHTLGPLARVYTVAEAETVPEFLEKVRLGQCFVWGSEMGFRVLLSDVYRMVFRYYGSVLDLKNPEFTRGEKARHLALAAVGAPITAAGVPLAITSLNYVKQIFVTRRIGHELMQHLGDEKPS